MNEKTTDITGYATLLHELRDTDSETGLLTRTRLYNRLIQELARCDRYGNRLSVVSLRIVGSDGQPPGNGSGALAGRLGNYLGSNVRNVDFAGRWSEWDFLVVLPETDLDGAGVFVDKITRAVGELTSRNDDDQRVEIDSATYGRGDDAASLLSKVKLGS